MNECGYGEENSKSIYVNSVPSASGIITGDNSVCKGETGVLYSIPVISNADNYIWTLPSGASIASGNGTNRITVNFNSFANLGYIFVKGENECGYGTESTYFIQTHYRPATPDIIGDTKVCLNQNMTNYKVSGATYEIDWFVDGGNVLYKEGTFDNKIYVKWTQQGQKKITASVRNEHDCTSSTEYIVNVSDISALDNPEIISKFDGVLVCKNINEAFESYIWYHNEEIIGGATEQFYEAPLPLSGTYYAIATDKNSCTIESNHLEFNGEKTEGIKIYPNPAKNEININLNNHLKGWVEIKIYNNIGKLIISECLEKQSHNLNSIMNTSGLSPGIYLIDISSKKLHEIYKFIKE